MNEGQTQSGAAPGTDLATRLERIEANTQKLAELAESLPSLFAIAADTVDEQAASVGDVAARVRELTALVERMSRPETLRSLRMLVDLAERMPDMVAIAADSADEALSRLETGGMRVEETATGLMDAAVRSVALFASPRFRGLLDSALFESGTLSAVRAFAQAIAEAQAAPPRPLGLFGVIRAMGTEPVQHAVGFALQVLGRFGAGLGANPKQLHGRG